MGLAHIDHIAFLTPGNYREEAPRGLRPGGLRHAHRTRAGLASGGYARGGGRLTDAPWRRFESLVFLNFVETVHTS
jgi:hypothetical protein